MSEGEPESERLYRSLGYFSLISLLKLHTLLGDYGQALNLLRHVRLDDQVCTCVLVLVLDSLGS